MSITKVEEYVDRFKISQNKLTTPKLQEFIDYYERRYLIDLLGKELYDLFIADLALGSGTPTEQRFIDIWEEIYIDKANCLELKCRGFSYHETHRLESEGIPEMLRNFMFYEYTRKQGFKNTIVGNLRAEGENSSPIPNQNSYMFDLYNTGILSYMTIAYVLKTESEIYPEYKGIFKDYHTNIY